MTHALTIHGDAAHLPLLDASVDLIVTSPPYYALRSYTDGGTGYPGQIGGEDTHRGYVDSLIRCTTEWVRVLKPTGSLWVNLGDKYQNRTRGAWRGSNDGWTSRGHSPSYVRRDNYPEKSKFGVPWRYALRCIDDLGLLLRQDQVWEKTTPMPESVTDRCRTSHEYLFHFSRQRRYYANLDQIREPGTDRAVNPLGVIPGSVWRMSAGTVDIPAEIAHASCCGGAPVNGCTVGLDHEAVFPTTLPRRIIDGWCPAGGVVLDPFAGTGTTAVAAVASGRTGISVDMSADYCRVAQWRVNDPAQRALARRKPGQAARRADAPQADQMSLDLV